MGDSSEGRSLEWEQQYALAKMMLLHYGAMHSFFQEQMQYYCIACCNISLPGTFKLHPESKTITYEIKTEKYYRLQRKTLKKRHPVSAFFKIMPSRYTKECSIAVTNLNEWTKKLLWGDETSVKVFIDGREQQ